MKKKCVLVSGSSVGLGSEIIKYFAKNNYNCVINYLNHEVEALSLKSIIESSYNIECLCIKADISYQKDIDEMYNKVIEKFGNIDVLVNNASISKDTSFENKTKEDFMRILEVNLVGTFLLSRKFGDLMFENKKGKIINISSNNALDSYYEYSLDYDSSKSGVINLTHNLANHYAPYINVNCICPGWINTPMNKCLDKQFKNKEENKILLNRFANPNEIVPLVYFLANDEANYINDSIIRIDGGKRA